MTIRNIQVPYHIRIFRNLSDLYEEIQRCLDIFKSQKPFFCFDPVLYSNKTLSEFRDTLEKSIKNIKYCKVTDSLLETAQMVQRQVLETRSDIIIAIGGGKCLDVAKYSAAQLGISFIAVPTQAAHDGICSPIAVLEMKKITYSLPARSPEAVLIDLPTIMNSPERNICAGIGDLISNVMSVKDWKLAEEKQGEKFDDFAALLASQGPESILGNADSGIKNEEFIEKFLKGLVMSGIAMEIAGSSRPCSGAEHQISHAMDQLFPGRNALHGEQVALGTVISAVLWDYKPEALKIFLEKFNLPSKISKLGFNKNDFIKIMNHAPQTRPGRYTILNEVIGKNESDKWVKKLEDSGIFE